jgi:hypothetical protein
MPDRAMRALASEDDTVGFELPIRKSWTPPTPDPTKKKETDDDEIG